MSIEIFLDSPTNISHIAFSIYHIFLANNNIDLTSPRLHLRIL